MIQEDLLTEESRGKRRGEEKYRLAHWRPPSTFDQSKPKKKEKITPKQR